MTVHYHVDRQHRNKKRYPYYQNIDAATLLFAPSSTILILIVILIEPRDSSKTIGAMLEETNRETTAPLLTARNGAYGSTHTNTSNSNGNHGGLGDLETQQQPGPVDRHLNPWEIVFILSTAFAYGCILTTLFLITLPVECARIQQQHPAVPKAVALGIFVAIAGVTQLVSPLVGQLSDTYRPPKELGQRMPYLVFGTVLTVLGLLGQSMASTRAFWVRYSFAFFLHMIGLNVVYSMMIALIPDQVPKPQTGMANGSLALLLVTGSLFGFSLFHTVLAEDIQSMYGLYTCIAIVTTVMTCSYANDRDVLLADLRKPNEIGTVRPKVSPTVVVQTMLIDPLHQMDWATLFKSYTIDSTKYHDFFIVTVSRTFYYMGISVQTFFLYFVHDIIDIKDDPESAVALLAILSQCVGALTCYPAGLVSDRLWGGRRKPFVYLSCAILSAATLGLVMCTNMHHMTILCMVLGGANGMYLTMDTSLAVDTLPTEQEEGESGTAQLLGVWGVAGFIGSALGPMIGGPLLFFFGDQDILSEDGSEEYSIRGYAVILSLSAFYFLCSALVLRRIEESSV